MSILILNRSAHSKVPYEKWLRDSNEKLVLLTSSETADTFYNKNYEYIESFDKYESNNFIEIRALELHKKYQFKHIIAVSELDIVKAGHIRELLNIEGQSIESANIFRNKICMKDIANRNNLRTPVYKSIQTSFDLFEFVEKNGYPVIIKPIDGVGAMNTTILTNYDDLKDFLSNGLSLNLEVETFVEGEMYHIDGLVINDQIVINWPSKYINSCLAYKEGKYVGSYTLSKSNKLTNRLRKFVNDIIEAFPTPSNTAFHAEVFHTTNDELVLCEIASRAGGAKIDQQINQAFDINIIESWIKAQCSVTSIIPKNKMDTPKKLIGTLLFPPRRGVIKSLPKEKPPVEVLDYKITVKPGQRFLQAKNSADNIAFFILKGETEENLLANIEKIGIWFEENTVWEQEELLLNI
ncbi:ATP-grasp domain-containing protein [Priestia megaterium]